MKYHTLLLLLVSNGVFAQTNTGSITGTVHDQQSAVMEGVKLTVTNLATNVKQTATSSNAGVYSLPALEPGTYRIAAEIAGFNKLTREPIQVETSKTVTVDLEMAVGNTAVEVTVKAESPIVQESSSTIAYTVNQKQIDELPLANQSALQVLSLLPGIVGDPGGETVAVTTGYVTPGGGLSVSGGRMGSTLYQADGVSNTSQFFGRISLSFSSDAIAEISVLQNVYSAEFGRVGGGVVNMTTKSGTNQIHGTVFSLARTMFERAPTATARQKGMVRYWRGASTSAAHLHPQGLQRQESDLLFAGWEPCASTRSQRFARVATEAERQGDFSVRI